MAVNNKTQEGKERSKCCKARIRWEGTYPKCSKCGDTFFPDTPKREECNPDSHNYQYQSVYTERGDPPYYVEKRMLFCSKCGKVKYLGL